jgi:hypothetical protein
MVPYLLIIQFQESHICSICLNMVLKSIRRLNRVGGFMDLWKFMLLLGGIINIFSGFVTLVWPEVFRKMSYHFGYSNLEGDDFDPPVQSAARHLLFRSDNGIWRWISLHLFSGSPKTFLYWFCA